MHEMLEMFMIVGVFRALQVAQETKQMIPLPLLNNLGLLELDSGRFVEALYYFLSGLSMELNLPMTHSLESSSVDVLLPEVERLLAMSKAKTEGIQRLDQQELARMGGHNGVLEVIQDNVNKLKARLGRN